MAVRLVLFDLEGTLIDVECIAHHREAKQWKQYVAKVSQTHVYEGIGGLLARLAASKVSWAVVTNVPSMLAEPLLRQHALRPQRLVCFHDVPRGQCKPHPAMCHQVMNALGIASDEVVGVGDRDEDARAFSAAKIPGFCAGWNTKAGSSNHWTASLASPSELLQYL